jgi:hypothetical protein
VDDMIQESNGRMYGLPSFFGYDEWKLEWN